MKHVFLISLLFLAITATSSAKRIQLPVFDINEAVQKARQFVQDRKIDVTHYFLMGAEYKNLHEERQEGYWEVTWALAAGADARIVLRVAQDGTVKLAQDAHREKLLPDSTSPDKHCRVVVAEMEGWIAYRVENVSEGTPLISISSSYQVSSGDGDWGFQQSLGASVHWRDDSQCVAIDEANHRRMGTVFIARRTKEGFKQVPADRAELMHATKQPWERARLFFGEWGRGDTVTLGILGLLVRRDENRPREEFSASVTLGLTKHGIIAIEPKADETK